MSNESEVKPMDGLAAWLRSQAAQLDGAPWRNDPAVHRHVETLRLWAGEVESARRTPAQAGAGAVAYMDAAKFAALRKCPERGGVLTTVTSHRAFPEDVALYASPPAALLEQANKDREALTELRELAKLAYRALCDAEAVINTIDGGCVLETVKLEELQGRIGDCALHLFTVLGLPTSELRGGTQ